MVTTQTQNTVIDQEGLIIPEIVISQYPDLVEFIKQTESMDLEEKNYWFKIMPMMTAEQIENLRSILVKERQKLDEINQKYSQNLTDINERHHAEIIQIEKEKQKEALIQAEKQAEVEESEEEKALLQELAQL